MKTILVINDNSPTARHAVEFAMAVAQKVQANILLANTVNINNMVPASVIAGNGGRNISEGASLIFSHDLSGHAEFKPEIEDWDISAMDENKVAELINKKQIWMMVKGMGSILDTAAPQKGLNGHSILGKVLCPLLIVPANWRVKAVERMVYIADLRYCHTQIVRYLAELARPWKADVSIANLTAKGLPEMATEYAQNLFEGAICNHVNYDQLFINNIREKNIKKVVDVLIHGLHNDILVMVNRQFHFEETVGSNISNMLPEQITIPLLIFPN